MSTPDLMLVNHHFSITESSLNFEPLKSFGFSCTRLYHITLMSLSCMSHGHLLYFLSMTTSVFDSVIVQLERNAKHYRYFGIHTQFSPTIFQFRDCTKINRDRNASIHRTHVKMSIILTQAVRLKKRKLSLRVEALRWLRSTGELRACALLLATPK